DGFSGRRSFVRSRRSGSRRTARGRTEESECAATADSAQCDEGDWSLDRLSPAGNKEQSRWHWSGDHSRVRNASPDQVPAGWFRIPRTALQRGVLRSRYTGRNDKRYDSLAERTLSEVDRSAG